MDQFSGLSKLRPKGGEGKPEPKAPSREAKTEPGAKPMPESGEGGKSITIHDKGDGSYHSETHDGTHEEHPDLLHATTHAAHHMAPESKHHHSSHDGFSTHTHGVDEAGQHQGTNEHESSDEAANEMKSFMGGGDPEGQEPEGTAQREEEPATMGGM